MAGRFGRVVDLGDELVDVVGAVDVLPLGPDGGVLLWVDVGLDDDFLQPADAVVVVVLALVGGIGRRRVVEDFFGLDQAAEAVVAEAGEEVADGVDGKN